MTETGTAPRYFVIYGVMRTGSNLLERKLAQFDGIACHGELFNAAFIGSANRDRFVGMTVAERDTDPIRFLERMVERSDGDLPGFRLFHDHDPRVLAHTIADPTCRKIVLRRPVLESYVSLKIARKTDQWLIGNVRARRSAKVVFDAAEFAAYRAATERFYADLKRRLQVSGQGAFDLTYDDVQSVEVLNGLARYLGCDTPLEGFEDTIQRQNPGPLSEKVENYDEMVAALGATQVEPVLEETSGPLGGLKHFSASLTRPILYAAIPGGPNRAVRHWLNAMDDADPESPLTRFENRKALSDWQLERPDHATFTIVRHPVARAYDVFERRILPGGARDFPVVRAYLRDVRGMQVPDDAVFAAGAEALSAAGYDAAAHRAAFGVFLDYLRANLNGQTPHRIDGRWAPQHRFVEGFSRVTPLTLVEQEERVVKAAAYLRTATGQDDIRNAALRNGRAAYRFPLAEIWSENVEAFTRAVYGRDYLAFGFRTWQPDPEG
ncbi:MAG: nodulation protein NodH [Pseudomonadota bacterium]